MVLQKRIKKLLDAITQGMYEREEIIAVSLLGALCGQNTFLYGPPGTAKSLISRRIASAFEATTYFEYLMNRFSTPEEVFGPVSIKALKEDQYVRKTEKYLPKAEFAFLDEIWKSSPAILNALLTLINERIFRNGETIEKAPLKALIAASNETPDANQGLEALYDRFIVRLMVGPIEEQQNFEQLLNSRPTQAEIDVDKDLRITREEWDAWFNEIHAVTLSPETILIIHLIRAALIQQQDELAVYVSDRRWQRAAILMKASAFFNGRQTTNHSDALLLEHCLWTQESNRQAVFDIVKNAVKEAGFDSGISLKEIDREKESLDVEIHNELFHSADIYETVEINGKSYFKYRAIFEARHDTKIMFLYIQSDFMKSADQFHPVDETGNLLEDVTCKFENQGACEISYESYYRYPSLIFNPKIIFHKGDKKSDINSRLILSLAGSVNQMRKKLHEMLNNVELKQKEYLQSLQSPFTTEEKINFAISGIAEQIDSLRLRIKDCERLEALCK